MKFLIGLLCLKKIMPNVISTKQGDFYQFDRYQPKLTVLSCMFASRPDKIVITNISLQRWRWRWRDGDHGWGCSSAGI